MGRATIEHVIWRGNRALEAPVPRPELLTGACRFCIVKLTDIAEVLLRSCVGTAMTESVEGTTK